MTYDIFHRKNGWQWTLYTGMKDIEDVTCNAVFKSYAAAYKDLKEFLEMTQKWRIAECA